MPQKHLNWHEQQSSDLQQGGQTTLACFKNNQPINQICSHILWPQIKENKLLANNSSQIQMCQTTKNTGTAVPLKYLWHKRYINIKIEWFLFDPTE